MITATSLFLLLKIANLLRVAARAQIASPDVTLAEIFHFADCEVCRLSCFAKPRLSSLKEIFSLVDLQYD